nr:oligosaccharide flippase family protein [Candidatus Dadabacteria bacterium]NIU01848.1 oligosaccharide flippase family protein [Nitrosopumilaceae archaeon]NIU88256.1 oligosaccharide flippase family protein [Nitrosopumilaceae archaeon]NIX14313.1 oligosaccharide flippase family protein [Candidatus Dadabacteria bacterium]NIX62449.1 oligosaccharide flippase family protein [Nitrosopumilaceae archaeon]
SLDFFTSSIGRPSGAILRKELKFKAITITRITSIGVSSVASILLALGGYGIWSLVIYTLLERIIRQFLFWFFSSWSPTFIFNKKLAKYYLTFGGILLISSQFNFIFLNMNQFIVGTWLSSVDLAFYNRAFSFTNYLVVITGPIISTAQPIYAESQENKRVLTKTYTLSLSAITHLSWPLSIFLFLVAPSFIELLIGPKWLPAASIFRVFILTSLTLPLIDLSTKLFNMVGHPKKTMKIKMLQGFLTSLSFPLIYIFGVKGVAFSMGIAASVGVAIIFYKYLPEHISVSFRKTFAPPLSAIISTLSIYFFLRSYILLSIIPSHPFSLLIELIFKASVFLSLYILFLFLIERERLLRIVKRLYKAFI